MSPPALSIGESHLFDLPCLCGQFPERSPIPLVAVEGPTHNIRYLNAAFARLWYCGLFVRGASPQDAASNTKWLAARRQRSVGKFKSQRLDPLPEIVRLPGLDDEQEARAFRDEQLLPAQGNLRVVAESPERFAPPQRHLFENQRVVREFIRDASPAGTSLRRSLPGAPRRLLPGPEPVNPMR